MNNMDEILFGSKSCFGQYENWDNSWHCKGCPIKDECESKAKERQENEPSQ